MELVLFNWILGLPVAFSYFLSWLTQPLPYINIAPIYIFSFAGLTVIITMLLVRLFVGG